MHSGAESSLSLCLLVALFTCVPQLSATAEQQQVVQDAAIAGAKQQSNKQAAAPYALSDAKPQDGRQEQLVNKNLLVLRLALNKSSLGEDALVASGQSESLGQRRWALASESGEALAGKPSQSETTLYDLKNLVETLKRNNFTSEITLDDDNSPRLVNITISSLRQLNESNVNETSYLSLEELLDEARGLPALNGSSILTDNHRHARKPPPTRSKLAAALGEHTQQQAAAAAAVTAPPLRRTLDVVAENYTARKIADEINVFALKLLHQVNVEKLANENLVLSPFAIYQGLALLLAGASGDTAKELDRVLLGSQSVYENTRLTHDQDRARLLASFGDVLHKLQVSSTSGPTFGDNSKVDCRVETNKTCAPLGRVSSQSSNLIVANNLLFSSQAFEISAEFKQTLQSYYQASTVLTRVETGSTESVQTVNNWLRRATGGMIPSILNRRATFDEFHVMSLLSTSWLEHEWRDSFALVASPLRSSVRLRGQGGAAAATARRADEPLLEFVDDKRSSHFTEFVRSQATRNIHHYNVALAGVPVDVVLVPLRDSNQRLVALTPLGFAPAAGAAAAAVPAAAAGQPQDAAAPPNSHAADQPPDASALSKLLAALANSPRRAMRNLWNTIAPDIITKQVYQNMQMAAGGIDQNQSSTSWAVPPKVSLSMPIVRTSCDLSLSAALNHIGIVNSFDQTQANFIGINGHPFNYNKLHLSDVLYKTTFNLNQFGINFDRTVRTLEPMRLSAPLARGERVKLLVSGGQQQKEELHLVDGDNDDVGSQRELIDRVALDKPFAWLVVDIKTRLVLYAGAVRNPAREATLGAL